MAKLECPSYVSLARCSTCMRFPFFFLIHFFLICLPFLTYTAIHILRDFLILFPNPDFLPTLLSRVCTRFPHLFSVIRIAFLFFPLLPFSSLSLSFLASYLYYRFLP